MSMATARGDPSSPYMSTTRCCLRAARVLYFNKPRFSLPCILCWTENNLGKQKNWNANRSEKLIALTVLVLVQRMIRIITRISHEPIRATNSSWILRLFINFCNFFWGSWFFVASGCMWDEYAWCPRSRVSSSMGLNATQQVSASVSYYTLLSL